jgi:trigger factor
MEISKNEIEYCKLAIKCAADAGEILNKRATVLEAFKQAPVKGFRKGKVSIDAIKMQYRDQIEDALKRALAEDCFHEALFQLNIKPMGQPKVNNLMMEGGKFICEFDLHIKPDFELAPFKGLEVPRPHYTQTSNEVAQLMMQDLRVRFGDVVPYTTDDFIQTGDNVIVDYEGSIDGVKIDTLTASGEMLTVGQSHLPSFDDNLLGMAMGDTREFDLVAPAESLPSIAGKTIHLKVSLNIGSKSTPCPLDDTLAQKLGKKDFVELQEFVNGSAVANVENNKQMKLNEAVSNRLIDDNKVQVPNWLTLSEAQYLVHQAKMDWTTLPDLDKERYLAMAERNVKLALILDKVRDEEPEAQLTDQEVFEIVKNNIAQTKVQKPVDEIMQEMNKNGMLGVIIAQIRDQHSLSVVVKSAKVIE